MRVLFKNKKEMFIIENMHVKKVLKIVLFFVWKHFLMVEKSKVCYLNL